MKHKLFLFVILLGFFACQDDDDTSFGIKMSQEGIRFKPVPGGAVMYYTLPSESDVFALNVRYSDFRGHEVLKVGSYGCDSLILDGFNQAQKGILARVSLVNRSNEESSPIEVTFDTEDSAPYAFFDQAEVTSFWNGFMMSYQTPDIVAGMVHVLYLGTNPLTQQLDTLLLKSFPINQGGDTLFFQLQQERANNVVIIRTEDYRGYRVRQKIWDNIEAYQTRKVNGNELEFIDVQGLSVESENDKVGVKYLFDGDTKGEQRRNANSMLSLYTFLAGPQAWGAPFILDMKEKVTPASIRIYGMLNMNIKFPSAVHGKWSNHVDGDTGDWWLGVYRDKLPSAITVYASNDKDGNDWVKIGNFYQHYNTSEEFRWSHRCTSKDFVIKDIEALEAADPAYCEVEFVPSQEKYRYLKLVVDEIFNFNQYRWTYNKSFYLTMHELEVYIKK